MIEKNHKTLCLPKKPTSQTYIPVIPEYSRYTDINLRIIRMANMTS